MKTRDIKDIVQKKGAHGIVEVLEALSEENKQLRRDLNEMGLVLDKTISSIDGMLAVASNMKGELQRMRGEVAEEDLGPSTQSLS